MWGFSLPPLKARVHTVFSLFKGSLEDDIYEDIKRATPHRHCSSVAGPFCHEAVQFDLFIRRGRRRLPPPALAASRTVPGAS
ncbi:hypothetical protein J6590_012239 [Homalodisca vitripennis]|nr:hypothetical protein J6590_012239 [Homalodisca vitripennis]